MGPGPWPVRLVLPGEDIPSWMVEQVVSPAPSALVLVNDDSFSGQGTLDLPEVELRLRLGLFLE